MISLLLPSLVQIRLVGFKPYVMNKIVYSGVISNWFSNMQEFMYVRIFKVQSLSVQDHGCFLQYVFFKVVVGRFKLGRDIYVLIVCPIHKPRSLTFLCV